jgi:hypothetical protein
MFLFGPIARAVDLLVLVCVTAILTLGLAVIVAFVVNTLMK